MSRNNWTDDNLFFRLVNNKSGGTYWDNIGILRNRATREVFDKAIALTFSDDAKARDVGVDVLAQLGSAPRPFYRESNRRFFELLEVEQDRKVLSSVLSAIGHNNDRLSRIQINRLCRFAESRDTSIKKGVVFALLGIKNQIAIDTLIKLSTDRIDYIRDWATFGLGNLTLKFNNKIRAALWARVNDKDQNTRYEAISGLASHKDLRVKEIIMRELLSGTYGNLLFDAIIEDGDMAYLPILKQQYKEDSRDANVKPEWLKDLKNCISELSKKLKPTK